MFQKRQEAVSLLNREYIQILKRMEEKLGFRYPSVTADSGYESEEGYEITSVFPFRLSEGVALSSNLIILRHPLYMQKYKN